MKKKPQFAGIVATVFAVCLSLGAHATVSEPPATMPALDAAHLDAALAHIQLIQAKANAEIQPYAREVERICAAAKIEPAELGKTVFVDGGGAIKRKSAKP